MGSRRRRVDIAKDYVCFDTEIFDFYMWLLCGFGLFVVKETIYKATFFYKLSRIHQDKAENE